MDNSLNVLPAIEACNNIKLVYRRNLAQYQYKYKLNARIYNAFINEFCDETCLAIQCNGDTGYKPVIYDYTKLIDMCISENASMTKIIGYFAFCSEKYAVNYLINDSIIPKLQSIIDANILAIARLNTYVAEQHIIEQLETKHNEEN